MAKVSVKNPMLSSGETPMPSCKRKKAAKGKIEKVMHEWKEKKLRSGSKKGPVVKDRKQALAIAISESRKAAQGKKK